MRRAVVKNKETPLSPQLFHSDATCSASSSIRGRVTRRFGRAPTRINDDKAMKSWLYSATANASISPRYNRWGRGGEERDEGPVPRSPVQRFTLTPAVYCRVTEPTRPGTADRTSEPSGPGGGRDSRCRRATRSACRPLFIVRSSGSMSFNLPTATFRGGGGRGENWKNKHLSFLLGFFRASCEQ